MSGENRIIGEFGGEHDGPLLICFASVHGNEHAGVKAVDLVMKMLEVEPITNPEFDFKGKMIGLIGNRTAYSLGRRYVDLDLNRQWTRDNVKRILKGKDDNDEWPVEWMEMKEILDLIQDLIAENQPQKVYLVDLHTTSAAGGIFSICTDDEESISMGQSFHAPVIKGFLKGIKGTFMHYFNTENLGVPTTMITFESGQHKEPLSVNRAIAAVINVLKHIGCIRPEDVENQHIQLLKNYSQGLPSLAELRIHHPIRPGDGFQMLPGFKNFDKVSAGQKLAEDHLGPIMSPLDGLILMPLYQKQGADGFFIIEPVES
jgi:succinylglutamate desuccinylase